MKKGWMIILIAVSMVMFCVLAFAGDSVQDKTTSQNAAAGEMMLANNSQTTPQVVNDGLEGLRVEQEVGKGLILAKQKDCVKACATYTKKCCTASDPNPWPRCGDQIYTACNCSCP